MIRSRVKEPRFYDYDNEHKFIEYFTTSKRKGINLGYEYEFDVPQATEIPMHKLPYGFIIQRECIGQNDGYELKSPIAPLWYHKLLINKFPRMPWNRKPNGNQNEGGIHVHIDKKQTTIAIRDSIAHMFYHHRHLLLTLSGRKAEMFNQYALCDEEFYDDYEDYDYDAEHGEPSDSHYNILNTEHEDTYEFRLFAAHPKLLLPALEMADSLFEHGNERGHVYWDEWVGFIKRWPRYQHIYERVRQIT